MDDERKDAFMQAAKLTASFLEFALFVVTFFSAHDPKDIGFLVIVLLSSLSIAAANVIDIFEDGSLYLAWGDPPKKDRLTMAILVAQGFVVLLDLALLALLGVNSGAVLALVPYLYFILGMLASPSVAIELYVLLWKLRRMRSKGSRLGRARGSRTRGRELPDDAGTAKKRDEEAFDLLWRRVVLPMCGRMTARNGAIHLDANARERVWCHYVALNEHVSRTYMRNPQGLLDRHKVAACYSYAILQASPLWVEPDKVTVGSAADFANERLAMMVACSVVTAELRTVLPKVEGLTNEQRARADEQLRRGLRFPTRVSHGNYVESVLVSLKYTRVEGTYNVLQYALLIYHWERCTLDRDVHHRILSYYRNMRTNGHTPPC